MLQVSFRGYGDPYRTIAKKYADYGAIENTRNTIGKAIEELQSNISELQQRKQSLIHLINNNINANIDDVKIMIENIENNVILKQNEIEQKRAALTKLWYGYHERL